MHSLGLSDYLILYQMVLCQHEAKAIDYSQATADISLKSENSQMIPTYRPECLLKFNNPCPDLFSLSECGRALRNVQPAGIQSNSIAIVLVSHLPVHKVFQSMNKLLKLWRSPVLNQLLDSEEHRAWLSLHLTL